MGASHCSAADLAAGYARRELDPVSVTEAALEAARAAQTAYNAISAIDERCLSAAEESRERFASGAQRGPLDGVPVTVKDSYHCEGLPRWHGSAVHDGLPPSSFDSAPVRRLREAGAIVIAKTTMPDFGMLASGVSSQFGIITNPWDTSQSPGGSSSGAGATLAAGVTPIALGTDIGGSVRLPAAHCGLAAIKPTQGRIAYAPASMARSAGPMARFAADLETMLEVVGRPDPSDPWCLPGGFTPATWGVDGIKGMRIALLTDMGYGLPVDAETLDVVATAADQLALWGAEVRDLRLDVKVSEYEALELGFKVRALAEADGAPDGRGERLLGALKTWSGTARDAGGIELALAGLIVDQARDRVIAATAGFDMLLAPVMPVPTFPADQFGPSADVSALYHGSFTMWFNQTGQPAATICGGRTASGGMPIGIQIAGRRFCDADVLRVAVLLEEALAVDLPWPGLGEQGEQRA
jgi:aspartyl-tRNA(Asn)/glutamyl-tRNA(Gln) amidotransferase subunit A